MGERTNQGHIKKLHTFLLYMIVFFFDVVLINNSKPIFMGSGISISALTHSLQCRTVDGSRKRNKHTQYTFCVCCRHFCGVLFFLLVSLFDALSLPLSLVLVLAYLFAHVESMCRYDALPHIKMRISYRSIWLMLKFHEQQW